MTEATRTNNTIESTDQQVQALDDAKAALPKCPECGGPIHLIQFVAHQVQRFVTEFYDDGNDGIDTLAYSQDSETLDVEPVMETLVTRQMERPAVRVECRNGHSWLEPRLRLTKQSSDGADWEIRPEPAS